MVKVPEHIAKIADKYIGRDGGPPAPTHRLRPAYPWIGIDRGAGDLWAGAIMSFAKVEQMMELLRKQPRDGFIMFDEKASFKAETLAYLHAAKQLQSFIPAKQSIETVEPAERNPRAPRIALDMNRQPRSPRASRTTYLAKQRAGKHKV